jgi:hypothetical protein
MSFFTPFAFVKSAAAGIDPDAQAFITATGISGSNATAINTLVVDLKAAGVYSKLQAAYPFIGGTAAAHKYNLINPQDTNAAFRLDFVNGATQDSNGVTFNGTNQRANTFFAPSTNFASGDSAHLSVYNRTSGKIDGFFLATRGTSGAFTTAIQFDPTRANFSAINVQEQANGTYTSLQGFILANRSGGSASQFYFNTTEIANSSTASSLPTSNTLLLGARNSNTGAQAGTFTAYNCAFATIGTSLTSGEVTDLYNAIQAYQTTLGRQV